ncbi:ketoacyl-ACP synthase III [Selenomonas sp. KH1T6]|uniref:ketoacyl-ACP synthase III n=1 Tax=Selenomonas sp. KH1T6 TaxID=3158784 RepID=UPI0008A778FB|nr:3-oxoacyl-[acyl-carrier-protein] synthase-3 [Selenomonas ruminantium]
MIINKYKGIEILGIAAAVPKKWQSLKDLVETEQPDDFNLAKFEKMTGVKGRYVAKLQQTTADLCYEAGKKLLNEYQTDISEIGALIFVSQCPDYTTPATACVLQYRLGGGKGLNNCIAFDVNLGCSGFVYGLNIIAGLMASSNIKKALMLCGDTFARSYHHYDDRVSHSSKYLFGDMGTATLLENTNSDSELCFSSCTDGAGYKAIIDPYKRWRHPDTERLSIMDDVTVFNFSTEEAPAMIKEYMAMQGTHPDDYDSLVLHQANLFIMKQIAKRSGFSKEQLAVSIDVFGNTSSASIPATFVKQYGDDDSADIKRLLTCGFGVGLSWAVCDLRLSPAQILPLVKTDEYFRDDIED